LNFEKHWWHILKWGWGARTYFKDKNIKLNYSHTTFSVLRKPEEKLFYR
jgi:hypothetical protein